MFAIKHIIRAILPVAALSASATLLAQGMDVDDNQTQQAADSGEIEEIVVSARKREQVAQDIPISLYAVLGKDLDSLGVQSVEGIRDLVAGVEIVSGSPGALHVSVRGVSNLNGGRVAPVGYYLDESPISGAFGNELPEVLLWDIERVEFLRGPQGTLFGEGSMGGTIRVISNSPDPEALYGQIEGQSFSVNDGGSGYSFRGMINIPLTETLALRAVISQQDLPGWIDIPDIGLKDANKQNQTDLRLRMRWQATDRLTVDLSYMNQDLELDSTFESTGNWVLDPRSQVSQAGAVFEASTHSVGYDMSNLTIEYAFESFTLVSATSYLEHELISFDDWSPQGPLFFGGLSAFGNDTHDEQTNVFAQDFRLVSAGDQSTEWTVGAYFKNIEHEGLQTIAIEVPAFGLSDGLSTLRDSNIDSWAVYADLDHTFTSGWSLQLGARYYSDKRKNDSLELEDSFIFGTIAGSLIETRGSDSDLAPHLGLTWQAGGHLLFARVAKGFRSGNTNEAFAIRPEEVDELFAPESLWTFELGSKNMMAEGRIQLNAYLYYNDWSDIQVTQGTDDGIFLYTDNVGAAESFGGELELLALPRPNLIIAFNLSVTDAEFTRDLLEFGEVVVASGNSLPFTPKWTVSTSVNYHRPLSNRLNMVLTGYYSHRNENFSDATNTAIGKNDSYDHLQMRAGIESDSWAVHVFVDNALNDDTTTFKIKPASAIPLTYFTQVKPRSYGVVLRWRF